MIQWLNYHHLLYFWTVAKEGSFSAASRKLRLAQPKVAFRYADEIFSLGTEMQTALLGEVTGRRLEFSVGISDALPKLVAFHLLQPAFALGERIVVRC